MSGLISFREIPGFLAVAYRDNTRGFRSVVIIKVSGCGFMSAVLVQERLQLKLNGAGATLDASAVSNMNLGGGAGVIVAHRTTAVWTRVRIRFR